MCHECGASQSTQTSVVRGTRSQPREFFSLCKEVEPDTVTCTQPARLNRPTPAIMYTTPQVCVGMVTSP